MANTAGGPEDVRCFLDRAVGRLNAGLKPTVLVRLAARGLQGTLRITFEEPAPPNEQVVFRRRPLPSKLADFLLESALPRTRRPDGRYFRVVSIPMVCGRLVPPDEGVLLRLAKQGNPFTFKRGH